MLALFFAQVGTCKENILLFQNILYIVNYKEAFGELRLQIKFILWCTE